MGQDTGDLGQVETRVELSRLPQCEYSTARVASARWNPVRSAMSAKLTESEISNALCKARSVVVLTGAGVSAESGIPTFRDRQTGLWEQYDAAELATPEAFDRDAALVWGWYEWRRMSVLKAEPNPAHRSLVALKELLSGFTLATQNVDDLHERAGSPELLHLHGSLARPRCERCGTPHVHPPGIPNLPLGGLRIDPPRCFACGGRVRPGVVWFGESLPELEWMAAVEAASHCDAFLSVGTSSLVQPAASLVDHARRAGAMTVQVNPNPTGAEHIFDGTLQGPAGIVLPRLIEQISGRPFD